MNFDFLKTLDTINRASAPFSALDNLTPKFPELGPGTLEALGKLNSISLPEGMITTLALFADKLPHVDINPGVSEALRQLSVSTSGIVDQLNSMNSVLNAYYQKMTPDETAACRSVFSSVYKESEWYGRKTSDEPETDGPDGDYCEMPITDKEDLESNTFEFPSDVLIRLSDKTIMIKEDFIRWLIGIIVSVILAMSAMNNNPGISSDYPDAGSVTIERPDSEQASESNTTVE